MYKNSEDIYKAAIETIGYALESVANGEETADGFVGAIRGIVGVVKTLEKE